MIVLPLMGNYLLIFNRPKFEWDTSENLIQINATKRKHPSQWQ